MNISTTLETLRWFQETYPLSHVGGSIGLMLHGVDLKRSLSRSDLDMTVQEFDTLQFLGQPNTEQASDVSDFDGRFRVYDNGSNVVYTKIEVRTSPNELFEVKEYEGHAYRITPIEKILEFKRKYAANGAKKHIDDLYTIEHGELPPPPPKSEEDFGLPF
jgi:hypothetical protein